MGAGLMGAGIAQVSALAGIAVVLKDREPAAVARGEKHVSDALSERVRKKRMTPYERGRALSAITGVSDADERWGTHVARCDAVVEAVFEDVKVKHARRFLEEGNKVKITVRFRGREITHPETAERQLIHIMDAVKDIGIIEQSPRMEAKTMTILLSPKPEIRARVAAQVAAAAKKAGTDGARADDSSAAT